MEIINPYHSIDEVKKISAEIEKRLNEDSFISRKPRLNVLERELNEKYKPTRKEIFNEIKKQIKSDSGKELDCNSDSFKEDIDDFIDTQKMLYAFPSFINGKEKYGKLTSGDNLGICLEMGQFLFYTVNLVDRIIPNHPLGFEHNYWLIPVITNAISGLYEAGKFHYKNAENKLIEKHNKTLEKEVKE